MGQTRRRALHILAPVTICLLVAALPGTADPVASRFGSFSLVDHTGSSVTDRDFRGRWVLVFFGYTHCPDICPTTLATVSLALRTLDAPDGTLQPLFITVDPERDTPARLHAYLQAFDPRIRGLTGSLEQVSAATRSFRAGFERVESAPGRQDYTVDHTGYLYLLDPDGSLRTAFTTRDGPATLTAAMRRAGVGQASDRP